MQSNRGKNKGPYEGGPYRGGGRGRGGPRGGGNRGGGGGNYHDQASAASRLEGKIQELFELSKFDRVSVKEDKLTFAPAKNKETKIFLNDPDARPKVAEALYKRQEAFIKVEQYYDAYDVSKVLMEVCPTFKDSATLNQTLKNELHILSYKDASRLISKAKTVKTIVDSLELFFKALDYNPKGRNYLDCEEAISQGFRELDAKLSSPQEGDLKDYRFIAKAGIKYYTSKKTTSLNEASAFYDKAIFKSILFLLGLDPNKTFGMGIMEPKEVREQVLRGSIEKLNGFLDSRRVKDQRLYEVLDYLRRLSPACKEMVSGTTIIINTIIQEAKIKLEVDPEDVSYLESAKAYIRGLKEKPAPKEQIHSKLKELLDQFCYYKEVNTFAMEQEIVSFVQDKLSLGPNAKAQNELAEALLSFVIEIDSHNFWAQEALLICRSASLQFSLDEKNLEKLELMFESCKQFLERAPNNSVIEKTKTKIEHFFLENAKLLESRKGWKSSNLQDQRNLGMFRENKENRKETVAGALDSGTLPKLDDVRSMCRTSEKSAVLQIIEKLSAIIKENLSKSEYQEYCVKFASLEEGDLPEVRSLKADLLHSYSDMILSSNKGQVTIEVIRIWDSILSIEPTNALVIKKLEQEIKDQYATHVVVLGSHKSGKSSLVVRCMLEELNEKQQGEIRSEMLEDMKKMLNLKAPQLESKSQEYIDQFYMYNDQDEFLSDKTLSSSTLCVQLPSGKNLLFSDTSSQPSGVLDLYSDISCADIVLYVMSIDEDEGHIMTNLHFKEIMRSLGDFRQMKLEGNTFLVVSHLDKSQSPEIKKTISPPIEETLAKQIKWFGVSSTLGTNIKSLLSNLTLFSPLIKFSPELHVTITCGLPSNAVTRDKGTGRKTKTYLRDAFAIVESGILYENSDCRLLPFGKEAKVRTILNPKDQGVPYALPGARVVVCLETKEKLEIEVGQALVASNSKQQATAKVSLQFELSNYFQEEAYLKHFNGKSLVFSRGLECSLMYKGLVLDVLVNKIRVKGKKTSLLNRGEKAVVELIPTKGKVALLPGTRCFLFKRFHYLGAGTIQV